VPDKTTARKINIRIEDLTGRTYSNYTVNMSSYNTGVLPVNVQQLSNGAYLLKVESNNKTTVKQFIINR
jgi:hypothetical protein